MAAGWIALRLARAGPGIGPPGAHPALVATLLFLAGAFGGAEAGSLSLGACSASIEGGTPIIASGVLLDRIPGGERRAGARAGIRLGRVDMIAGGRRCRVPGIRATVPREPVAREVGLRVVVRGTWRPYGEARLPRAIDRHGYVSGTSLEELGPALRPHPAARLRGALARRLDRNLPSAELAAVGKALLLADRTTLDRDVRRRFVDAGIVHLLAISGLHVGMIAGAIVWVLGLLDRSPRRWIWAAWLVTAYVGMIGAPPAAVRAALLFWGHAFCRWRDRPGRTADLAGAAAILALSASPLLVTDVGFQLSFAGYIGVVLGHRMGTRAAGALRGPGRPGRLRSGVATLVAGLVCSAGAFLLTAPIAALHFGRVVATSIPASLASTALVALTLPALSLTAVLPGPFAGWMGGAAGVLLAALIRVADAFAGVPLKWRVVPETGWWLVGVGLLGLGTVTARRVRRRHFGLALAAGLAAFMIRPTLARVAGLGRPLVCTLDVGQGDAAVVRTGAGRWLVFDAGPGTSILEDRPLGDGPPRLDPWTGDAGRNVLVPYLRAHGATEIELLALSHPHLDHFGGSGALFDAFRVRYVLDPGLPEPSVAYLAFLERVDRERAVWIKGTAGTSLTIDDVQLRLLWPPPGGEGDANETSLAFRLTTGAFAYVNTGDAPAEAERRILEAVGEDAVRADLLKLGHHGSRTSSAVEWLRAVRPSIVVASLGRDNRYGHPHAVTLARLDSARVRRVWRTDREGTLCIEADEDGWRIVEP